MDPMGNGKWHPTNRPLPFRRVLRLTIDGAANLSHATEVSDLGPRAGN